MNCPNCNSNINPGDGFCSVCGTQINSQQAQSNQQVYNTIQNTISYPQPQEVYNQPTQNNVIDTEALIDAFVGPKIDKMRSCGFSGCTFFFGIIYVLYRKMWLLGILWYAINLIVSLFLPSFEGFITFVIGIIVSIQFKSWYMIHAKEKVAKIKRENPEKSQEQLIAICKRKGGTSKIVTALIVLYFVLILIAIFMPLINNSIIEENLENIMSSYFRLNFWDIWNK